MQTPKRKLSEAAKASLSARRKGQNNPNAKYIYIINGKRFEILQAATDFYNLLNKSNLSSRTVQRKCLKQADFCYTLLKKTLK